MFHLWNPGKTAPTHTVSRSKHPINGPLAPEVTGVTVGRLPGLTEVEILSDSYPELVIKDLYQGMASGIPFPQPSQIAAFRR